MDRTLEPNPVGRLLALQFCKVLRPATDMFGLAMLILQNRQEVIFEMHVVVQASHQAGLLNVQIIHLAHRTRFTGQHRSLLAAVSFSASRPPIGLPARAANSSSAT